MNDDTWLHISVIVHICGENMCIVYTNIQIYINLPHYSTPSWRNVTQAEREIRRDFFLKGLLFGFQRPPIQKKLSIYYMSL